MCVCYHFALITVNLFIPVISLLQEVRSTIYEQLNSKKITNALKNKYAFQYTSYN